MQGKSAIGVGARARVAAVAMAPLVLGGWGCLQGALGGQDPGGKWPQYKDRVFRMLGDRRTWAAQGLGSFAGHDGGFNDL